MPHPDNSNFAECLETRADFQIMRNCASIDFRSPTIWGRARHGLQDAARRLTLDGEDGAAVDSCAAAAVGEDGAAASRGEGGE